VLDNTGGAKLLQALIDAGADVNALYQNRGQSEYGTGKGTSLKLLFSYF